MFHIHVFYLDIYLVGNRLNDILTVITKICI